MRTITTGISSHLVVHTAREYGDILVVCTFELRLVQCLGKVWIVENGIQLIDIDIARNSRCNLYTAVSLYHLCHVLSIDRPHTSFHCSMLSKWNAITSPVGDSPSPGHALTNGVGSDTELDLSRYYAVPYLEPTSSPIIKHNTKCIASLLAETTHHVDCCDVAIGQSPHPLSKAFSICQLHQPTNQPTNQPSCQLQASLA
jgi:hypothetical protein